MGESKKLNREQINAITFLVYENVQMLKNEVQMCGHEGNNKVEIKRLIYWEEIYNKLIEWQKQQK